MTSFYNGVPHSSSVSEISSAPPSPVSCNTAAHSTSSPGNAPRFGVVVPNRVFVGGIASNTTETELQELFSQYGTIKEIKIISDRGGVCKGYGFVTFETEEEAKKVQHQPDTIVLKERRLNIAPAVMKQQPFGRPYDPAPPTGALVYHNGTTYTYQNGMAFFTATNSTQAPGYSISASRETSMYAAPFGPGQTSAAAAAYPQIMYPYTQPMPYLTPGQQYPYSLPFDYFKAVGPTTSPYIYAQPGSLNGALNSPLNGGLGNPSQSPSPGYGQSGMPGPTGGELYYNGTTHPAQLQHQPIYPMESSPAHSEDWNLEPRQAHTPVVSLLKLHQEGSLEELEITRTPRKSYPPSPGPGPGSNGPRPRSRRPGRLEGQGRPAPSHLGRSGRGNGSAGPGGPGASVMGNLAGQRSASSPHLPSTPNSCLHRSTSLSPSNQVAPVYNSNGRQVQQSQQQSQQYHHQQGYHPRRGGGSGGGGNSMRNTGPKIYSGKNPHHNSSGNYNSVSNQTPVNVQNNGQHQAPKTAISPKNPGESVNGLKAAAGSAIVNSNTPAQKQEKTMDDGGAGDASTVRHTLPLSPPNTPLPQESSAGAIVTAGGDGDMCQKMKTLTL